MATLKELEAQHAKRLRQLKNADPEQVGFLKKKIRQLEDEMKSFEAKEISQPKPKDLDLVVKGKKIKFNEIGVASLPYGSILKKVDQKHYIIIYNSNTAEDAELSLVDGNWIITCCKMDSYPEFGYEDLGLAITYVLDNMHEKYGKKAKKKSGRPKKEPSIIEPTPSKKKSKSAPKKEEEISIEGEDANELKKFIKILTGIKGKSKTSIAKRQIQAEIDRTQRIIDKIEESKNTDKRIKSMVDSWNDEGRAFSKLVNDDSKFFEMINIPKDEVGIASQTGSDLVYYNVELFASDSDAIKNRKIK